MAAPGATSSPARGCCPTTLPGFWPLRFTRVTAPSRRPRASSSVSAAARVLLPRRSGTLTIGATVGVGVPPPPRVSGEDDRDDRQDRQRRRPQRQARPLAEDRLEAFLARARHPRGRDDLEPVVDRLAEQAPAPGMHRQRGARAASWRGREARGLDLEAARIARVGCVHVDRDGVARRAPHHQGELRAVPPDRDLGAQLAGQELDAGRELRRGCRRRQGRRWRWRGRRGRCRGRRWRGRLGRRRRSGSGTARAPGGGSGTARAAAESPRARRRRDGLRLGRHGRGLRGSGRRADGLDRTRRIGAAVRAEVAIERHVLAARGARRAAPPPAASGVATGSATAGAGSGSGSVRPRAPALAPAPAAVVRLRVRVRWWSGWGYGGRHRGRRLGLGSGSRSVVPAGAAAGRPRPPPGRRSRPGCASRMRRRRGRSAGRAGSRCRMQGRESRPVRRARVARGPPPVPARAPVRRGAGAGAAAGTGTGVSASTGGVSAIGSTGADGSGGGTACTACVGSQRRNAPQLPQKSSSSAFSCAHVGQTRAISGGSRRSGPVAAAPMPGTHRKFASTFANRPLLTGVARSTRSPV